MIAEITVLILLTFVGTYLQTVTGFGGTLLLLPALLAYFNAPTALTVSLLVANVICLLVLFGENRQRQFSWPIVLRILVPAIPGILLGAFIATHTSKPTLQIIIGIVIVSAALIQEYVFPQPKQKPSLSQGTNITGFSAGLLNAAAVLAAPPIVLWLRRAKVAPNVARDTMSIIFLCTNSLSVIVLHLFKPVAFTPRGLLVFVLLTPFILIANRIGRARASKIKSGHYHKLIFALLVCIGLLNIILGATSL